MAYKPKTAWAVRTKGPEGLKLHLAYNNYDSPEQAKRAFEKHTGKSWAQWASEGAEVVKHDIIEVGKPGHQQKKRRER